MKQSPLEISLHAPRVAGQRAEFSWSESRPSGLYQKTGFWLEFPASVPLSSIPESLWWTVFLLCLHAHWPLLRPCRILLPVKLQPEERELWQRLMQKHADTLDALNPARLLPAEMSIEEGPVELPSPPMQAIPLQCAMAYSGGKDSLSHVGLLGEMGFKPILVSTTSIMPGVRLEGSTYRARALEQVQSRRNLELIEVRSDFRGQWHNLLPREWGYRLSVNEITDTLLYTAALTIVGYARGATHLFLASENEVSANAVVDGVFLQHSHFMYSGLTQASVSQILEPYGLWYGSLTSSLQSSLVQELVTRRYPDLADLQCSCWRGTDTRRACSNCSECRRLALISLACGGTPLDLGVDMIHLLKHYHARPASRDKHYPHPPDRAAARGFRLQYARAIRTITPLKMLSYLVRNHPGGIRNGSLWVAWREYRKLYRETLKDFPKALGPAGYRAGYLDAMPEPLRNRLEPILSAQFSVAPVEEYAQQLSQLQSAIRSVTSHSSLASD